MWAGSASGPPNQLWETQLGAWLSSKLDFKISLGVQKSLNHHIPSQSLFGNASSANVSLNKQFNKALLNYTNKASIKLPRFIGTAL